MQLVDKNDGVLALHQFLHDGLQPLFELPAVFRAGHDQRKVERKNALVREERRHVAVGDALRQPFDDRRLANARLADQHGIVLRAAAQDLDGALELAFAADERVELTLHRRLRQIAAEFREQRSFFRPVHRHLLSRAASHLLAHGGKPQSAFQQDFRAKGFLLPQNSQEKVFRSHVLVSEPLGFFGGVVEDALALLAQGNFDRRGNAFANGDARFNFLADGFDRAVRAQEPVGESLILAHQPEQQMLGLDVRAAILAGLVPRKKDHSPRFLCVAFKHGSPTLPRDSAPGMCCRDCEHLCARSQLPVLQGKDAISTSRQ